jgi:hypothetical protein
MPEGQELSKHFLVTYSCNKCLAQSGAVFGRSLPQVFSRLLMIALALIPFTAQSQTDRSSIRGTVTDPQGNRVPKAVVRVTQISTGLERVAETKSQGTYALEDLPIGVYSLAVYSSGFAAFRAEGIVQDIEQARTLDVQLSVAKTSEETTITEALIKLDRSDAVLGAPIEQEQIYYLPLNGRNWSSLTALVPGAIDSGTSDQRSIRFAGHGLDDNNFTFDGVDATGILNQAQKQYVRLAIPTESISEFQVQSANFNADTGMTAGGQVSVASPSGTNSFHGNVFEFLRNDVFDSRSPFDGASPGPFRLNQFGAALGGPIAKDKTFFFANYEGIRQTLGQTQIGLVPSPAFIHQTEAASPALKPILSAYPAGTSPKSDPRVLNYIAPATQTDNEDSGMIRIDQHFSDNTTAFLRFSADEAYSSLPTGALNAASETGTHLKNGVAELLHVFSPSVVNEAKFGINQDIYHTASISPLAFSVVVPGLSKLSSSKTSDAAGTTYSWVDDLTWVKGRHIIKSGVTVRLIHMNQGNSQDGTLTYSSLSNFAANVMDNASVIGLLPLKRMRKTQGLAYIQDEFKVTHDLTVNMGLRYSFFNVFHEVDNRAIPFDFETCGGYCPAGSQFTHPRLANVDPRLALAWTRGKTVLRAGAGIYHSDGQLDDQNLPVANDIQRYSLTKAGFPGLSYPVDPFLQSATGVITPRSMYRNRKDMYVSAWTASIERTLPGKIVGNALYAGNKGTNLLTTTYTNVINPLTGLRSYPDFGIVEFRKNDSNSTFHAMQLSARRAFQQGWLLSANYMWSHSINDGAVGGGEAVPPQNVNCRACDKANSDQDVRSVFNTSVVYALPFGAGKRFLSSPGFLRSVFGNWQLSGIGTARSGLPVNVTVDRSNSSLPDGNSVSGYERPDVVAGVSLTPPGGQTPAQWINPAAFATPANGTWGNTGRNIVRGPNLWQIDAALAKTFTLTERIGLECRAEAFNIVNRAQYGSPLADISSPLNFGQITAPVNQGATGSGTPRQFQFALRLSF